MRIRRTLLAAALAVAATASLSACQTKIGLAASVDGQRLTDSDLSTYVKAGTAPYTDTSTNTQVVPKVYVLQNWIDAKVFANAIAARGTAATTSELNQARDVVLGGRTVAAAETFYTKLGYTTKFAHLIIDQSAVLVVLVERVGGGISPTAAIAALQNGQANSALLKSVSTAKAKVVVSSRYGKWDATKLALTATPGAGAPSFIHFGSTAPTAAATPPTTP